MPIFYPIYNANNEHIQNRGAQGEFYCRRSSPLVLNRKDLCHEADIIISLTSTRTDLLRAGDAAAHMTGTGPQANRRGASAVLTIVSSTSTT
jgi:hypothetical protein